jgi:hypothetical protein
VDDVNNMDESMDAVEKGMRSRVSRRDMIKASVVASGLVWSAPILLTGKAAAAPGDLCCSNGTAITFKVPSGSTASCVAGTSCLDNLTTPPTVVFPCPSGLVQCLVGLGFVQSRFQGQMQATVTLAQGITLIAAGVKASSACYTTVCPCFPTSTGTCPSLCTSSGRNCNNVCQGSQCTTSPPNVITVDVVGSTTTINVNTSSPTGNGHNIDTIQLSVCVPHAVTGMCPH